MYIFTSCKQKVEQNNILSS